MSKNKIWELLVYQLEEGTGAEFRRIMMEESLPLHDRKGMKIIRSMQSLHDPDSYVLIREYENLKQLEESQDKFYHDPDWIEGPREKIIRLIQTSSKYVVPAGLIN